MSQSTPGFNNARRPTSESPAGSGNRCRPRRIYQTTAYVFRTMSIMPPRCSGWKAFGQHLHPHHEPHPGGAGGAGGGPGGRHGGPRWRRRRAMAAQLLIFHSLMRPGDNFNRGEEALWRLDQPVRPTLQEFRLGGALGRYRRSGIDGADLVDERDPRDLRRKPRQSWWHLRRPRENRRCGPRAWPAAHRRQYDGHALSRAPHRTRCGCRGPLADQVHGRPRQFHGRRHRGWRDLRLVEVRQLSDALLNRAPNMAAWSCTRPLATSPSPSPAGCSAARISVRRSSPFKRLHDPEGHGNSAR